MGYLRKFKCKGIPRGVFASMSTIFYALIILVSVPWQGLLRSTSLDLPGMLHSIK